MEAQGVSDIPALAPSKDISDAFLQSMVRTMAYVHQAQLNDLMGKQKERLESMERDLAYSMGEMELKVDVVSERFASAVGKLERLVIEQESVSR